ncbi:uroporphyrinogen-III synthase [Qipengyuania sphaerica]|uniref:uroporphyrinogen-III synthase n=1 Tax=Qipengyuania sphaerica TaxID=2867243 RepID=UPI001C88C640|nr:uroporphyrinogen-III synthase [Qipengyuania sphaerica]MBX7540071.1 uroporphyrinogen-III synthase [Qipengyuania sphaerica]
MRKLFVFRPEPGLGVTLETAEASGLEATGCALFLVEPVEWSASTKTDVNALLVGSSNVFRHGGLELEKLEGLPVYAVGGATAEGAREKGFLVTMTGKGGLQNLLDEVAGRKLSFLRLAGEKMVDLSPPDGISIDTRVVYRTVPLEMDTRVSKALREEGGVALLHSGEAAKRLASECERLGIDRNTITIAALGPRIAEIAGDGWQAVHTSPQPVDAELLALAQALCQG